MLRRRSPRKAPGGAYNRKQVIVRMCKSHRIGVITISALLIAGALVSMIVLVSLAEMDLWMGILLCAVPVVLMLPLPLYCSSWQITLNANGIHKRLFWINTGTHSWAQVKEVRSTFSYTEHEVISILFKDGKTMRFRMICENADKARKLILSHHSIKG